MNYYLINGKVMKGDNKMPEMPNLIGCNRFYAESLRFKYSDEYNVWLSSLQPCSITESELEKVKDYFKNIDFWDESKIADITELIRVVNESYTHNGNILGKCSKIYFKQQEETNEAVVLLNSFGQFCTLNGIKLTDSNKVGQAVNDFLNSDIYEIFKNKK